MAEQSAKGIVASPEKKVKFAITKQNPPNICIPGRRVFNAFHPPSNGKNARVMVNAIIDLNNTTS